MTEPIAPPPILPAWAKGPVKLWGFAMLLGAPVVLIYFAKPTEAGIALAAGAFAIVFSEFERFKSIKAGGVEVEMWELKKDLEVLKAKASEPQVEAPAALAPTPTSVERLIDAKVLGALMASQRFAFRTLKGICTDAVLDEVTARRSLGYLVGQNLVRKTVGDQGELWAITPEGQLRALGASQH